MRHSACPEVLQQTSRSPPSSTRQSSRPAGGHSRGSVHLVRAMTRADLPREASSASVAARRAASWAAPMARYDLRRATARRLRAKAAAVTPAAHRTRCGGPFAVRVDHHRRLAENHEGMTTRDQSSAWARTALLRCRSGLGLRDCWPSGRQVPAPLPCGIIPLMGLSSEEGAAGYGDLHATVVDAVCSVTAGQSIEEAADEVLQRLPSS